MQNEEIQERSPNDFSSFFLLPSSFFILHSAF